MRPYRIFELIQEMAYGVHIRRKSASKEIQHAIALEEWLVYIGSDKEMNLKGAARAISPMGEIIAFNAPGLAEWTDPHTGTHALFDYSRGRVSVGNPTHRVLIKMLQIATALGAIVEGDAGERYDAYGNPA